MSAKMTNIPKPELHGSARACNMVNKCSKLLLKGECHKTKS